MTAAANSALAAPRTAARATSRSPTTRCDAVEAGADAIARQRWSRSAPRRPSRSAIRCGRCKSWAVAARSRAGVDEGARRSRQRRRRLTRPHGDRPAANEAGSTPSGPAPGGVGKARTRVVAARGGTAIAEARPRRPPQRFGASGVQPVLAAPIGARSSSAAPARRKKSRRHLQRSIATTRRARVCRRLRSWAIMAPGRRKTRPMMSGLRYSARARRRSSSRSSCACASRQDRFV